MRGSFSRRRVLLCLILAAVALPYPPPASAGSNQQLYRVDIAGIGSCYDADLSLMLAGHVFAYVQPGALEVYLPEPPRGFSQRERVVPLGDAIDDFSSLGSQYFIDAVLGKNILLAFDSTTRDPSGALLAYIYLPRDGTCVNLRLVRDGYARVSPADVVFQFRGEFEMYEQQARDKGKGIWAP
ncbi:MAG TPA: thermonuclease family protein [Spirochaetia bacterium]|nr:thermonuclease family protein [Spirochaetia bacterium]